MSVVAFRKKYKENQVDKLKEIEALFLSIVVDITDDIGPMFRVIEKQSKEIHDILSNVNINNEECVNECNKAVIDIIHKISDILYEAGGICKGIDKRVDDFIY